MMVARIVLSLALVLPLGSFGSTVPTQSLPTPWLQDPAKMKLAANRTKQSIPMYTVDLDAPEATRWAHIVPDFKAKIPALVEYLDSYVPKWALPIVKTIGKDIEPYFHAYGAEMVGLATAMGISEGYVVALNLVYQLESLGLNCSNWNVTGPTVKDDPGCEAVDPKQTWCYCKEHADLVGAMDGMLLPPMMDVNAPGLCTSVVAQDAAGGIWHGRNLDWNLPASVLELAIDVNFTRSGKHIFTGSTVLGFVGLFNGMVAGGFSASIDARGKGGKAFDNLLEALLHRGMTPSQHLRYTLETQNSFEGGVTALATGNLIDEVYYIVGGTTAGQGTVISRDRSNDQGKHMADKWSLNGTEDNGWFRLQTNYDHWQPVPEADDRRTPGRAHMAALGQHGLSMSGLVSVLSTWPTFNDHTDYTGVYCPLKGTYKSFIWL